MWSTTWATGVRAANQGTDTVISLLSTYQLPDNVEIGSIGLTTGATLTGNKGIGYLIVSTRTHTRGRTDSSARIAWQRTSSREMRRALETLSSAWSNSGRGIRNGTRRRAPKRLLVN